jgi:hypothetical protein
VFKEDEITGTVISIQDMGELGVVGMIILKRI